ncbi:type IV pilus twitching motility protein PilT [Proteiniclasticum ruminis]|uniref:type IV pilus twitching motility protein PilT n=1 Tax=Proteiniclasticum ruminis TaxID=398199 RepID=UPI0028AAA911|nr:type IV pilus twitching motility protein PilT [Proteiniclasticum ruminis]
MIDINALLKEVMDLGASDLHITVAIKPTVRIHGDLMELDYPKLLPEDTEYLCNQILSGHHKEAFLQNGEVDLSYTYPGIARFRVNVFKQRNSMAMALRAIPTEIPTLEQLMLPDVLHTLAKKRRGLILVTGPTGSGKSTSLAAMINYINKTRKEHIITLEDPIEYLHRHEMSMVNQREIGADSKSFSSSLRAALRQDPDVILVGEMRDLETISTALTAAETGHLVLATLHTVGAAKTIDRIIDVFPPFQQGQVKVQLAGVLEGIISQQLIQTVSKKGRVPALEIMLATPAIRNLIREGKTHQIQSSIQTGASLGMETMDKALVNLYNDGLISKENVLKYCMDLEAIKRYVTF